MQSKRLVKIGMLGGGSWATALVKILTENEHSTVQWWMKNADDVRHIQKFDRNPRYLSDIDFEGRNVIPTTDLKEAVKGTEVLFLAVPAAFIKEVLDQFTPADLKGKIIVSAIKGMLPQDNSLVTDYLENNFGVQSKDLCIVAGPCHSEEIAMEKRSYLTIAGTDLPTAVKVGELLTCRYVKTSASDDLYGVEYAAIMKNIVAIACGIARGLNYGDNYQAVLVSNAMQEMERFINAIAPYSNRNLNASAYLGDLLVTCYSQFSRNRMLGNMVGRGYSVKAAQMEMNMIAEGYYGVKCISEINKELKIEMPITKAVYNVLYERISPMVEIRILEDNMN